MPLKVPLSCPTRHLELTDRLPEAVHGVSDLLHAVLEGPGLSGPEPGGPARLAHVGLGVPGLGQADHKGGLGQLAWALLDLVGEGGERLDARGGVRSGAAF
uniref:Uncharacterized protein n=1 Tax=Opuntia streptacantha TaxID=393608 RepID=A0A7C8YAW6_OPUST